MQSEFRIVSPETAPDEDDFRLPDELGAIANRLQQEAESLAAKYPHRETELVKVARPPLGWPVARWKQWATASLAVALLATAAISAGVIIDSGWRRLSDREQIVSGTQLRSAVHISVPPNSNGEKLDTMGELQPDAPGHGALQSTADPISSEMLHGISIPELEGLLDLWEGESQTFDQLSI